MAKGRVLIVDDERAAAEGLGDLLASWGYDTTVEADGLAGLQRAEEFRPLVVITDVLMPHLDGFGLLRELRARYPEMAVILLTGQGSVEMALRAIQEEGAYHYFEKRRGARTKRSGVNCLIAELSVNSSAQVVRCGKSTL
jgi:DNA-binding NtrC family response regulator